MKRTASRCAAAALVAALLASAGANADIIDLYPTGVFEDAVESLNPGDTLIVHEGTYPDTGRISIGVQGTEASPVVITGAEGEARPHVTRPADAEAQNTINVEGASYLTIRGLEISSNGGDGVNLNSEPSYITLEDLVIHDVDVGVNFRSSMHHITVRGCNIHRTGANGGTGEGMYVGCNWAECAVTDSLIENNWIHECLEGTTQGDGIEVKWGSIRVVIRNNVIHDMDYPGIFVYGAPGSGDVNTVEGNAIWNCLEGIFAPSDALVQNNIIFTSGTGLSLYGHEQVDAMENVTAVGNTVYDCDDGLYVRWGGSNMVLANNAVYCPDSTAVSSSSGVSGTVKANYVTGGIDVSLDDDAFFDGGTAAAAFVDAEGRDFWPAPGSSLIGAADPAHAPPFDFNDAARTEPYDVGAYETEGLESNPGWQIAAGLKGSDATSIPDAADVADAPDADAAPDIPADGAADTVDEGGEGDGESGCGCTVAR